MESQCQSQTPLDIVMGRMSLRELHAVMFSVPSAFLWDRSRHLSLDFSANMKSKWLLNSETCPICRTCLITPSDKVSLWSVAQRRTRHRNDFRSSPYLRMERRARFRRLSR